MKDIIMGWVNIHSNYIVQNIEESIYSSNCELIMSAIDSKISNLSVGIHYYVPEADLRIFYYSHNNGFTDSLDIALKNTNRNL